MEEVVETAMTVRAEKSDYDRALQEHAEANESQSRMLRTPGLELPVWLSPTTPTTPTTRGVTTGISSGIVHLSPVRHRSKDKPEEQARLGIAGLAKLHMHINAEKHLEIEEEYFIED